MRSTQAHEEFYHSQWFHYLVDISCYCKRNTMLMTVKEVLARIGCINFCNAGYFREIEKSLKKTRNIMLLLPSTRRSLERSGSEASKKVFESD